MDRPILFSSPMVRALLAGTKTQTRRVLNPQPNMLNGGLPLNDGLGSYSTDDGWTKYRFWVGDRLWVREAWRAWWEYNDFPPSKIPSGADVQYVADEPLSPWDTRFRQGMHMPRWASRLTLTVTQVRVQRLQEIGDADARAEGVLWVPGHGEITPSELRADPGYSNFLNCREGYQVLWDHLNADRGFGWSTNPWVVAVSFSVEHRNIDAEASDA